MINQIEKKIKDLRSIYLEPLDQRSIDEIEKEFHKQVQESKLIENDFVKRIVDDGIKKIEEINDLLCNDRKLTDSDRNSLFKEKDCINYYIIQRLGGEKARQVIKSMEMGIDDKLN